LVGHVGETTWEKAVGDTNKWADAVWGDYNKLKHQAGLTFDPERMRVLAQSARLLLQIDLLNTAADKKQIGKLFLNNHQLNGLSTEVARVV
jgi:hypothetical protein